MAHTKTNGIDKSTQIRKNKRDWSICIAEAEKEVVELSNSDHEEIYGMAVDNILFLASIKQKDGELTIKISFGNGKTGSYFIDVWNETYEELEWSGARKFVEIYLNKTIEDELS